MNLNRAVRAVPALLAPTVVLLFAAATHAEPWVGPGDMALRHDLQQLADAGVLHAPTMSWPLPWSDIKQDIGAADPSKLSPRLQSALGRVQQRAAAETATGDIDLLVEIAARPIPGPCVRSRMPRARKVNSLWQPTGPVNVSPGSSRPASLPTRKTVRSFDRTAHTSR